MYGKGGTRKAVGRAVGMYDEVLPITVGMWAKEFLRAFRGVHAQWAVERDG